MAAMASRFLRSLLLRSLLLRSLLLLSLLCRVLALGVTPDSPCASQCADSTDTTDADVACEDSRLTKDGTGSRYKQCMSCLQNSTYSQDGESDQEWFLYNLRYSFDSCVFSGSNPCETSTACGTLRTALELGNSSTAASDTDEFGYCDADGGSVTGQYYQACLNCLSASGSTNFVANALVALKAGCSQRPNTTDALGLNGSVFSSSVIEIVDPSTSSDPGNAAPLSTVAIAGIAAGGGALVAIIAAVAFVRCRRRKNRTGILRKPRWDKSHKRRSSFSFKCRNILASPLSPKFFRDLDPVEEQHEPYGSLDAQMTGGPPGRAGDSGRYYIETKPRLERHPYETSLEGWHSQEIGVPDQHPAIVPDRWNTYGALPEKKGISRKGPMTIDTTEAALAPPPPTHPSPRANSFGISPSASSTSSLPQQHHKTSPTGGSSYYYSPEDLYRVAAVTANTNNTTVAPTTNASPSRGPAKPKTTTMSSQGSGYPSLHGQGSSSPLVRQQWHGPPGARENAPEPWFPPPPSSSEGPRPGSSSSAAAPKLGMRKVSPGTMRRGRRESGSPVESKQIQITFPGPPQR